GNDTLPTLPPGTPPGPPGAYVPFSVTATGTAPLSFQWMKNGTDLSGAPSSKLTLTAVTANDAGSYTVAVTNSAGSVVSAAATLTVRAATHVTAITSQLT